MISSEVAPKLVQVCITADTYNGKASQNGGKVNCATLNSRILDGHVSTHTLPIKLVARGFDAVSSVRPLLLAC